jgi:hypothetical protein
MNDSERVTIRHLDDLERNGSWSLARRSLGLLAFGMNVVEIAPGTASPSTTRPGATRRRCSSSSRGRRRC